MGVSRSPAELAGKLRTVQSNIRNVERSAVMAGANVGKDIFLASARAARTKGITVRVKQTTSGDHFAASVKYGPNAGWVAIMDRGAKPHFIGPRSGRGRARGSLRRQNTIRGSQRATRMAIASLFGGIVGAGSTGAINIKGVGPRAWAHHPGSRGKHFAEVAQAAAPGPVTSEVKKHLVSATVDAFR